MAIAVNGDVKLIHVGFSINKVECGQAWEWFLNHLKIFLVVDPSTMIIISNRHHGIMENHMLDTRSEVLIGHRGSDVRHVKESTNKSRRIRCLIMVKLRRIKVD